MENRSSKRTLFHHLPDRLAGLEALAENLWWSWNPGARMLFKTLDRQAWKESGHNPDKMLRELPRELLEKASADTDYIRRYDGVIDAFGNYMQQKACPLLATFSPDSKHAVAYLSAEYGLHRSLPFYAGGLGFLAGDYLKECSDLCVPLVAVGFMYPEGYFRQQIRDDGWQENIVESINREAAPISKVMDKDGRQRVVRVPLTDPPIHVAVWKVAIGRVPLYLLDTDVEINAPWNRGISARLYIGDLEQRLRQEIVLGLGGAEVLKTLGIDHYLLHLNEGHAAFALLERIRATVSAGSDFTAACEKNTKTTIFTTHTPVPAGHDLFPFQLIEKYFHSYWPDLGLDRDAFLNLGTHPEKPEAGFNMTAFALRLSGYRNAVSKRHAEVSRKMWRSLWPEVPDDRVPIDHVTNGVHVPTWIEPKIKLLQDLINLARDPQLGGRIAFVEDYGEQLAQYLVHGVDVWLNNPLPPFEACGTSGMKAALNGVPHLSVLDGWWLEGFNGKNGWAVNHDANSENPDASDAAKIYRLLEDQIIPQNYQMTKDGIPLDWVRLMKETMKSAAAGFSARRMVKQYIEKFYSTSIKNALEE